uniref:Uncharacterized protein n=1 Tax=Anguilla anguilla TaxID=7936 RepID=A0A0E9Q7Q1_ANGAN
MLYPCPSGGKCMRLQTFITLPIYFLKGGFTPDPALDTHYSFSMDRLRGAS